MRVALELQPCCGNRSGIGTYTYELARRLTDSDGLEFCGNLFNFLGHNNNTDSLNGVFMPLRVSHWFPYGVYRRLWHTVPIPYDVLFPGHADLSVFFNYIVPPHITGRVITTIHDLTYLQYPEMLDQKNLRRISRDWEYSLHRSDHILTITEFSKGELMTLLNIPADRISVISAAPAQAAPAEDFAQTAEKYGIRRPYVLYVGTIEPRKNLVRLIHAFDRLKKVEGIPHQLVLAGGTGWNNKNIFQTAKDSPWTEDILFTGYVSAGEKTALLQNAAAFAFPSLYEGFGIPPLEAMEQGCPVLCSNAASLPEVAGDAAVLEDPLDEGALANGLFRVLTDKTLRTHLIERGKHRAGVYTWKASAARLRQVCKEVLEHA